MRRIHRSDLILKGILLLLGAGDEADSITHADNGCRSGLVLTENGHQFRCGAAVDFCDRAVWLRQDDRLTRIRVLAYGLVERDLTQQRHFIMRSQLLTTRLAEERLNVTALRACLLYTSDAADEE